MSSGLLLVIQICVLCHSCACPTTCYAEICGRHLRQLSARCPERDDVEAIFILPTLASVEAFKAYDADLDRIADPDDQIFAYGVDNKDAFEAPLAGLALLMCVRSKSGCHARCLPPMTAQQPPNSLLFATPGTLPPGL